MFTRDGGVMDGLLVILCKSGRHRSVAAATVVELALRAYHGCDVLPVLHIGQQHHCRCDRCRVPGHDECERQRETILNAAMSMYSDNA